MNNINIQLNYYSNYKILIKSKKYWLFCKKFLSFLFLVNHIFFLKKNNLNFFLKGSFFFKKKKQKIFVILRAPYKNKLSRNQLTISRYFFKFNILIFLKNYFFFENLSHLFIFLKNLNYFFFFFETNICFLKSQKIILSFFLKNFFLNYLNYNN